MLPAGLRSILSPHDSVAVLGLPWETRSALFKMLYSAIFWEGQQLLSWCFGIATSWAVYCHQHVGSMAGMGIVFPVVCF